MNLLTTERGGGMAASRPGDRRPAARPGEIAEVRAVLARRGLRGVRVGLARAAPTLEERLGRLTSRGFAVKTQAAAGRFVWQTGDIDADLQAVGALVNAIDHPHDDGDSTALASRPRTAAPPLPSARWPPCRPGRPLPWGKW